VHQAAEEARPELLVREAARAQVRGALRVMPVPALPAPVAARATRAVVVRQTEAAARAARR
jgi:hypothetical protein